MTGAAITPGEVNNSGVIGYGFHPYLSDTASATFDAGSIIGDPNGLRFASGVLGYAYQESSIVVSNSTISGNEYNIFVEVADDGGYFGLVRSVVTNANTTGVFLDGVAGTALIDETEIDGNGRAGGFSGIYAHVSNDTADGLTISRSTVSHNQGNGMELYLAGEDASIVVVNSTVSGNGGVEPEAGIYVSGVEESGLFQLLHSAVTANVNLWAGLAFDNAEALVSHSIASANDIADGGTAEVFIDDDSSVVIEWSVIGSTQVTPGGSYVEGPGVKLTANPGVGPLANNGGPTQTHALLDTSPALNAGNPGIASAPLTDQRGEARIVPSAIDIGAVEMPAILPATGVASGGALTVGAVLMLLGAMVLAVRGMRRRVS